MKVVICGASAAGLSCLNTFIKEKSKDLECIIISEENSHPYSRCLLTYLLSGEIDRKSMFIASPNDYPENVKWFLGEKVTAIDAEKKFVVTNRNNMFFYDKLLLSTGADPIKTSYMDSANKIFNLRYVSDANSISKYLKNDAIVVGGGFVGIKTAYALIRKKINVSLVISSFHPLSTTVDEETGNILKNLLINMGINVITGVDVKEVITKNDSIVAVLSDGKVLTSDVVIVGKGVIPRIELIKNTSIKFNKGIIVDEYQQTSVLDIFAAGDCCESYDRVLGRTAVNAIWPIAVEQGRIAALNMLGNKVPFNENVAINSLKTNTFHLITAGNLKDKEAKTFQFFDKNKKIYRRIAIKQNVPVGMAFLNCPEDAGILVNMIKYGKVLRHNVNDIINGTVSLLEVYNKL